MVQKLTASSIQCLQSILQQWKPCRAKTNTQRHPSPQPHLEMLLNKHGNGQFAFLGTFFHDLRTHGIHTTYTFQIQQRNVTLHVIKLKHQQWDVATDLANMKTWLQYAFAHSRPQCSNTLTIHLICSPLLKTLPPKSTPPTLVDASHANTAFTTSCDTTNEILIYRYEEWFKVFLHETLHCLGFDFSELNVSTYNERVLTGLYRGVTPKTDIRIYESYCEFWGELLNILFLLYQLQKRQTRTQSPQLRKTKRLNQIKFPVRQAETLIHNELIYSRYQCAKLLDYFGFTYDQLCNQPELMYREKTQMISYYFLKLGLWEHMNTMLDWCVAHHSPENPIQFQLNDAGVTEYTDLLLRVGRLQHLPKPAVVAKKQWSWLVENGLSEKYLTRDVSREYGSLRMSVGNAGKSGVGATAASTQRIVSVA